MLFKPTDTVVFFGDSITEASKLKDNGEGALHNNPLGVGYVAQLYAKIKIHYPNYNLRFLNQGISGNRTPDLVARVEKDVLAYNPNWVFMMIGVNDAHRQLDMPQSPLYIMNNDIYRNHLVTLINLFKEQNIRVILATPFYLELNKKDILREKVDGFCEVCRELAKTYDLVFFDLQKLFDKFITKVSHYEMSRDRIHINLTGHMLIADHIFDGLNKR